MRQEFTPDQITMLVHRAERELQRMLADSARNEPWSDNIAKSSHPALHENVVSLIKLFRDQVPGASDAATRIAREYAKGVDARSGAPTLACVRTISTIVTDTRERHLPPT